MSTTTAASVSTSSQLFRHAGVSPWIPSITVASLMTLFLITSFVTYHCRYVRRRREAISYALDHEEVSRPGLRKSSTVQGGYFRQSGKLFNQLLSPCLTLETSSALSFKRTLEDGFGQRIVAVHMAKPCKLAAFYNG
ncbi:hypothetical protein ACOMHN_064615 [Nucella lapillus]